jgi:uncharacterized protein YecT (DUF1311 family)
MRAFFPPPLQTGQGDRDPPTPRLRRVRARNWSAEALAKAEAVEGASTGATCCYSGRMKLGIVLIAIFAATGAGAADMPLNVKHICDAAAQSAAAFHDCYAANLAAANKALDETYTSFLAQKTFYVGSRDSLRDVERAWIVYKDKECAYEYGARATSENYWLAHADCEIRVTEQRIRELQDRPSCTGGVCYPHMR